MNRYVVALAALFLAPVAVRLIVRLAERAAPGASGLAAFAVVAAVVMTASRVMVARRAEARAEASAADDEDEADPGA
jgi:predicted tellurium resistance membrane protein TerC